MFLHQQAYCCHYDVRKSPSFETKGSISECSQNGIPHLVRNEGVFERVRETIEDQSAST